MPSIRPSLPDVQWPEHEGVVGVVGVAPWATVDFLSQLYENAVAEKDWHFPRVLMDANSKIPSRGRYFDLGETDPSPYIAATIRELVGAGATAVVVPCNTAHILFDRWSVGARDQIVSIVDATLSELAPPGDGKIVTLGSSHLARHRIYLDPLETRGHRCVTLDDRDQALIGEVIGEIKVANKLGADVASQFATMLNEFQKKGVSSILLGCTELAQALRCIPDHNFKGMIIDSNAALARAALRAVTPP